MKDLYCYHHGINLVRIPYCSQDEVDVRAFLNGAIDLCRKGNKVHASYSDFHKEAKIFPSPGILVFDIPMPIEKT